MRIAQERLVFVALAALLETADQCDGRPRSPSVAVRACLSFLFAHSNGDRRAYDTFWRVLSDEMAWQHSLQQAARSRATEARTCVHSIARTVGVELTVEHEAQLRRVTKPKAERMAEIEREARLAAIKRNPWAYWCAQERTGH